MTQSVESILDNLEGEEATLEHYGVLGMRWGVRKDRRTGKIKGSPIKGTKAATREGTSKRMGEITAKPRKGKGKKAEGIASTASGESVVKTKSGKELPIKLNQRQKSKLGSDKKLSGNDLSIDQLRSLSERFRLENELVKALDGPSETEEMQQIINRIKVEREYRQLMALPPTKREAAKSYIRKQLLRGGDRAVTTLVDGAATFAANQFLISLGIRPPKSPLKKPQNQQPPQKKKK